MIKLSASRLQLGDILRDSNSQFCKINRIVPKNDKLSIVCGNETHYLDPNYPLVIRRKMM